MTQAETELCARLDNWLSSTSYDCTNAAKTIRRIAAERDEAASEKKQRWDAIVILNTRLAEVLSERDAEKARAEDWINTAREWNSQREALLKRVAALEAAAEPFVAHYEPWMDTWEPHVPMSCAARVTFGQLRTLRTLLEQRS